MRALAIATAAAACLAASATAHAKPRVKAELLCGTYVDGQVTGVVPSPKKPKLTDPVACALRVTDGGGQDGAITRIHTVRHPIDPATGKATKEDGADLTGSLEKGDDGNYKDLEVVWQPSAADDNGLIAFKPCEDFDVEALVGDAAGTYWQKTLHVTQSCPKPKAMKATADCAIVDGDGNRHKLKEAGLGSASKIVCTVTSGDDRLPHGDRAVVSGVSHYIVSNEDGTTSPGTSPRRTTADGSCASTDDGSHYYCEVEFQQGDWSLCTENKFDLAVSDPESGRTLFTKTIKYSEICGE